MTMPSVAQEGGEEAVMELMQQSEDVADRDIAQAEIILRSARVKAQEAALDSLEFETLLALSNTFRKRTMSDSAMHFLMEANTLAKTINRPILQAKALLFMGRIYRGLKLYDEADDQVEQAETLLQGIDAPAWQARTLQARSISAWYRGEKEKSHQLIQQAKRIAVEAENQELLQSFQMDQALQCFEDERYEQGLAIYDTLLGAAIRTSTRYIIYHNSITILLRQNQIEEAAVMSNAFLDAVSPDDPGNYIQALYDNILVLEAQGEFQAALDQYFALDHMEDSLYTEELSQALSDMQARFDVEQKEHELELASREIENSALRQRSLTIGLVALALLLVGGFFLSRQRIQNKALAAEAEQKEKEVYKLRNVELKSAYDQIEEKNREIMDSIEYAKRIQTAILPPDRIMKENLPNSFVLYKPKDVVAGDFYWMETVDDTIYFAAADCTGHGVPGAMVSVVCVNGLNRSVREFALRKPGEILDKTRELVIKEFEKSEEQVKDGMDISLCALNTKTNALQWAGAHNPLWIVSERDNLTPSPAALTSMDEAANTALVLHEVKADKQPIGQFERPVPFTTHSLQLHSGESIYVFTDGYPDQFGGDKGKKYKSGRFKKAILSLAQHPIHEQGNILDQAFETWKGDLEQIDDVCVIGVRV
jgi:serine phosphatase RsbU (regulator of sigma subunit)